MKDTQIIMLGTGNAGVTRCYNTCFAIRTAENVLLVDAGGGNGILVQLEKAGIAIERIHDMFVTHAHTDHILGAVWVIRMVAQHKQPCRGPQMRGENPDFWQFSTGFCRLFLNSLLYAETELLPGCIGSG